jgi:hypothetical protein
MGGEGRLGEGVKLEMGRLGDWEKGDQWLMVWDAEYVV